MGIKSLLFGDDNLSPSQERTRSLFMYLVCGGITTVVNIVCFEIFDFFVDATFYVKFVNWQFDLLLLINQTVAWIVAVVVAFVTNRILVFKSNGKVFDEFMLFVASRVFTFFVFELGTFMLFISICENKLDIPSESVWITFIGYDVSYRLLIKVINSIILIVANYVLSKLFIFKERGESSDKKQEAVND